MPLDRVRADEESCADLWVGQALLGQPCDLGLLRCKRLVRGVAAADRLPSRTKAAASTLGEGVGAHRSEHLMGGAQMLPGLAAPFLPTQPFPVDQVGTRQIDDD